LLSILLSKMASTTTEKDYHPLKVIEVETNITGYKNRKTHYSTIPARITQQVGYFFNPKEKVRMVMDLEAQTLTISKIKESK
jgi:hypothetical protein